jgi:hypothetical protein
LLLLLFADWPQTTSAVDEFEKKNSLIQEMMSQTGQDSDVCSFYLESVDWNYASAIEMYESMSAT